MEKDLLPFRRDDIKHMLAPVLVSVHDALPKYVGVKLQNIHPSDIAGKFGPDAVLLLGFLDFLSNVYKIFIVVLGKQTEWEINKNRLFDLFLFFGLF